MQIVENWANIKGKILSKNLSKKNVGFYEVEIFVEQINDIPGFKNLLSNTLGTPIKIYFPEEVVDKLGIKAGSTIGCRVRKASLNRQFVHRQHITIFSDN